MVAARGGSATGALILASDGPPVAISADADTIRTASMSTANELYAVDDIDNTLLATVGAAPPKVASTNSGATVANAISLARIEPLRVDTWAGAGARQSVLTLWAVLLCALFIGDFTRRSTVADGSVSWKA